MKKLITLVLCLAMASVTLGSPRKNSNHSAKAVSKKVLKLSKKSRPVPGRVICGFDLEPVKDGIISTIYYCDSNTGELVGGISRFIRLVEN